MRGSTRWSLVVRAGAGSVTALDGLCGAYWQPVYGYLRRHGHPPEDAAELTQDFFVGLLRRNDLARVSPEGGRFRAWLFTAVKRHHFHKLEHDNRQKRQHETVADAELQFARTAAPGLDPEQTFARQWALAVLATAQDRLRTRYESRGELDVFEALSPVLTGDAPPYAEIGASLCMKPGAVKVAVHRLRKRFGDALREEVADTLDGPADIDNELKALLTSLAGR